MKIDRESFLASLEMVKWGLSPREFIEQSSSFVFQNGKVMTYNDEIACTLESPIASTGAVQASNLLAILDKLEDPELIVEDDGNGELIFRGKHKGFGIVKEADVILPIDRVELPKEKDWKPLPKEFVEAVGMVRYCVSTDESRFLLCCIHIHPRYIEACDNHRLMRCKVNLGIESSILVRGTSLTPILQLAMDKVAMTKSWIHFKNQQGLVYSCRRYMEEYPSLDGLIKFDGSPITIPKGLVKATDRAEVFAADEVGDPHVTVTIEDGKVRVYGEGLTGRYWEVKKIVYDGPPCEFIIRPELLRDVAERYEEAIISETRLKAKGGGWLFVTVLGRPRKAEEVEKSSAKPKSKSKD